MKRIDHELERIFSEAALAEENGVPSLADEIGEAVERFECANIDASFAEEGAFTESACPPARA